MVRPSLIAVLGLVFLLLASGGIAQTRKVVVVRQPAGDVAQSPAVELDSSIVEVPMGFFGPRPVIEATVEGSGPYRFLLDTGATGGVIDPGLAEELGLASAGEVLMGSPLGDDPQAVQQVMSSAVEIGDLRLKDVVWATFDLQPMLGAPDAPCGIISARWFRGALVRMDFRNELISFRAGELPPDGEDVFQFDAEAPLPSVPVRIGTLDVECVLDTGSPGGITLPAAYADSLPLKSEPIEVARARTPDAEFSVFGAPLKGDVVIGSHRITDPEIRFSPVHPHGQIGQGILTRFSVTLDVANSRVQLSE
jgi:predicted aspartyl protease